MAKGPAFKKPAKGWRDLSPAYRKRMQRAGLTARNWNTRKGAELRTAARGHGKTPERPSRAERNPQRYPEYVSKRDTDFRAIIAKKERLFQNRIKYRKKGSDQAARINPETGVPPRLSYIRRFLAMSPDEVDLIDWSDDEWAFLYYH